MAFLFCTAIDTRAPLLTGGTRSDQMDRGGHYARWEDDFALAHQLGVSAVFYGPAYYRAHVGPERYDWETCAEPMERLRLLGIAPIAELCHDGVPGWMGDVTSDDFPALLAEYARAFALRFPWVTHFAPVHDIAGTAERHASIAAAGGGDYDTAFVRATRALALAHERAVEAVVAVRPEATIVMSAPARHAHAAGEGARAEAERRNARRALALDLCLGLDLAPGVARHLHDHGVPAQDLRWFRDRRARRQRVLSLSWTPDSERRVTSAGKETAAVQKLGLRHLATALHRRTELPLLLAETHAPARLSRAWLKQQWDDALSLRSAGVPVVGFGWSPLTDMPDLGAAGRELLDIGLADGQRVLRPVGELFRDLVLRWGALLDAPMASRAGPRMRRGALR
ncbi:MAG: hypothetical protein HYX65_09160 [Gemmatimonadetes bacterium]|nr:hypothetical protein [Gemmatimonadota bacterium]